MAYAVVAILLAALFAANTDTFPNAQGAVVNCLICAAIVLLIILIRHQRPVNTAAVCDPLTGLANRRGLDRRLASAKSRYVDRGRPLALISLDIDHFKAVNDRWGHNSGDAVLKVLANCCLSFVRQSDLVARLGGDEFVILLPGLPRDAAAAIAERIRVALESHAWASTGDDVEAQIRITASFGVAEVTRDRTRSFSQLFKVADARLYQAKEAGRNRVVSQ